MHNSSAGTCVFNEKIIVGKGGGGEGGCRFSLRFFLSKKTKMSSSFTECAPPPLSAGGEVNFQPNFEKGGS